MVIELCHAGRMAGGPIDEYEQDAAYLATLLHSAGIAVGDVLVLGCGEGRTAVHLGRHFTMTLLDPSPQLVAASQGRNPHCRHLVGDARSVRLDGRFDAVLLPATPDEDDVHARAVTAFLHCRPGGMTVVVPGLDTRHSGPFARDTWVHALAEAGFEAGALEQDCDEDAVPRTLVVGHRPRR
jgi:trans-aconitate methyltransferase